MYIRITPEKEIIQEDVYNDGSILSFTNYYSYDNWGNIIYAKNAEGHEIFLSYANTSTSGFFITNTGTVIRQFSNAFSSSSVPSSVHTVLIGIAEKQDNTYVREAYLTYDSEAHPTQSKNAFGNSTTWLTFSGTFNEKTGNINFPIDLTGHTITGNAVLQITGLPSDTTYQESHSYECPCNPSIKCTWNPGNWSGRNYSIHWMYCSIPPECDDGWASVGPFTHYPGTLGYQSYSTNPSLGGKSHTFTVTTNWKAYPAQVQYNIDQSSWEMATSNLQNTIVNIPVTVSSGSHTLYFSESSSYQAKFSWYLYVPVDNTLDTYTTSATYDIYGNISTITDAESNTVTLTYSSTYSHAYLTELSATVDNDIITTRVAYDYYRGWITSRQEPEGVAAGSGYDYLYTYDLLGRIIKKEFPLLPGQSQRSFVEAVYDCENRAVTTIDPLGHYTVREHDKLGRLNAVKTYTGEFGSGTLYATTSYTYNYSDQVLTITDSQSHTTTYTYDFLGRITQIQFPNSSAISLFYDDTNNKMIFTNERFYERIFWFNWLSQLTRVEEEYQADLFTETAYQYDRIGHLISLTDAENKTTSYAYGSLFGLTQITYPDSTYEMYAYDNVGNTTSFIDANGNETQFLYDAVHRLEQIVYEDQSNVSFTYDLNSNRKRMDDNSPDQGDYAEYEYDHWNRLITETRYISPDAYTVSYQYDAAGRLCGLAYPDNMLILYSYDDLNRITEIKRYIDGMNDEILMENVQYDIENFITQFDFGNGLQTLFSFDSGNRLLTLDVKNGETPYLDLDYTYDSSGNITQLVNGWRDTESDWHSQTESYTYDGLDRLISASCSQWSHSYSYDKTGNRTAADGITYTTNTINEVTALSDGTSFTYDSNGNRIQKTNGSDTWTYIYDYANRLTKIEQNSETLGEYVYDGDGKRIQVKENNEITTYIYFGLSVLYEENTTGTSAYVYGPSGRLAKRTTIDSEPHTYYYHKDHLNSTRLVTDESKTIITDAAYEPFGETTVTGEESYLYTGKQKDSTGVSYYGVRYYDPEIGRFVTRDPLAGRIALPQSLNRYTYCLNNPVKLIDPTGLVADKMCYADTGICYSYTEGGDIVFYIKGTTITGQELEQMMNSDNPQEQAKAAYLMLLITHPEIDGDPNQEGMFNDYLNNVYEGSTWFDFTVTTNGKEQTIHIGIDQESFYLRQNGEIVYAEIGFGFQNSSGEWEITMHVYQDAFSSLPMLFHIIGHEGVHLLDLLGGKNPSQISMERTAYAWNLAVSVIFQFPFEFKIPLVT